jgi:hypothetical protein
MVFGKNYFKLRPAKIDSLKSDSLKSVSLTSEAIRSKAEAARKAYSINAAILPLGWQLSEQALDRLKQNVTGESNKTVVNDLVNLIVTRP